MAGPGEIVVDLAACGVCGTASRSSAGNYAGRTTLGHEPRGRERGRGRRRPPRPASASSCTTTCPATRAPSASGVTSTFCPSYGKTNLDPAGFAEAFRVSAEHVAKGAVLPLSPSVSWEDGALLEPAACALTAIHSVRLPTGATVAVLGLGPVGLLYARILKTVGASWIGGTEISPLRREAGLRGGVDAVADPRDDAAFLALVRAATDGVGVDLAVVATGVPSAISLAFRSVRRGGTVNLFGLPAAGSHLEVDVQDWYLGESGRSPRTPPLRGTSRRCTRLSPAGA